jgi:hypothetical protein
MQCVERDIARPMRAFGEKVMDQRNIEAVSIW